VAEGGRPGAVGVRGEGVGERAAGVKGAQAARRWTRRKRGNLEFIYNLLILF
jgi:hypothetical protein